ncbi:MAG: hypothetical protein ACM3X4_12545 [Ignavibacteriales bacterium]
MNAHAVAGVVGPGDLVGRTAAIARREFSDLLPIPLCYQSETEALQLVERQAEGMDLVVFTGPVPYYLCRGSPNLSMPMVHVSLSGTSLYETLLDLVYYGKADITRLSVDTIERTAVEEIYSNLGIRSEGVITREYQDRITKEELVEFHRRLWDEGKTSASLTCLKTAHEEMALEGVPTYRVLPTDSAIRLALQHASLHVRALQLRSSQMAVSILNIDSFGKLADEVRSETRVQQLKIGIHRLLLDYCGTSEASVMSLGGDEFIIYTTRGALELVTRKYTEMPLLSRIRESLPITVSLGTGMGSTAQQAHDNARLALFHAKKAGGNCAFVVDEGVLRGPIGEGLNLSYSLRTVDPELRGLARKCGLSAQTLDKLRALKRLKGGSVFTAGEVSGALRITARSARRILEKLAASGLATVTGDERPHRRGRPSNVYDLTPLAGSR